MPGALRPVLFFLTLFLGGCVGYPRVILTREAGTASTEGGIPTIRACLVRDCERLSGDTREVRRSRETKADEKGRYSLWIWGLGWNWKSLTTQESCRTRVQLYVCRQDCRAVDEVDLDLLGK